MYQKHSAWDQNIYSVERTVLRKTLLFYEKLIEATWGIPEGQQLERKKLNKALINPCGANTKSDRPDPRILCFERGTEKGKRIQSTAKTALNKLEKNRLCVVLVLY